MLYIMHRTQLYLDDDLWTALSSRAEAEKTSISELVRVAARDRYLSKQEERQKAMAAIVGLRSGRLHEKDSAQEVRELRQDSRLERLDRR